MAVVLLFCIVLMFLGSTALSAGFEPRRMVLVNDDGPKIHDDFTTDHPETRQLLSAIVLFRHGDRTPVEPYPTDPYRDLSNWPVGFGQLTAKGKRMQYELGKYMRKRYGSILRETYNETDIYVRSTDVDRTLMSALSNLAGLYPPKGDQIWNPELAWQPIPVHTVPKEEDFLLHENADCPAYQKMYDDLLVSPEMKNITEPYRWLFDYLTENTGENVTDLAHVDYIYDTLYIEQLFNKTLPDWTKGVFPEKMEYLRNLSFKIDTWTQPMKRLRSGPLLQDILDRFEHFSGAVKAGTESASGPRMTMFSAHDTTIANILNALGKFDPPNPPPYASAIMVELYLRKSSGASSSSSLRSNDDDQFEMQFFYKNETEKEPYLLHLEGCSGSGGKGSSCTLEEYRRITSDLRTKDVASECQLTNTADIAADIIAIVTIILVASIMAVLLLAVILAVWNRSCRRRQASYGFLESQENNPNQ